MTTCFHGIHARSWITSSGSGLRAEESYAPGMLTIEPVSSIRSRWGEGPIWWNGALYYVDIEGHANDTKVAQALAELQAQAAFFKVLGSYPHAS